MATIKDVAIEAGVSIATVSHVVNKTRYVSPELEQKVEQAIEKTDYKRKVNKNDHKYRIGKKSEIAFIIPDISSSFYSKLISMVSNKLLKKGFSTVVYSHSDDPLNEKRIITNILQNKMIAGILCVPASLDVSNFKKIKQQNIPIIILNRKVDIEDIPMVLTDTREAIYLGCRHLLKAGHENIALVIENGRFSNLLGKISGFKKALEEYRIEYDENFIIQVNRSSKKEFYQKINENRKNFSPTAYLAGSNSITLNLLRTLSELGMEVAKDVSLIGYGDEEWSEIITPSLTNLRHDVSQVSEEVTNLLEAKLEERAFNQSDRIVPMELSIRNSTIVIGKGPFGEQPISPEQLTVSAEEEEIIKSKKYRVGISFHYGGTAWSRLYEKGIRLIFDKFGIAVVSITNAHFDPHLQVTQLEGLRMQKPNAIIAIPVDEEITAEEFQKIAKESKLVFLSHVPKGIEKHQYSSCVSVNERENGYNVAVMLGNYYQHEKNVDIGFIGHGTPFYGTHLRDAVANDVIRSNFSNITIVKEDYFHKIDKTYELCRTMIKENPTIKGMYISWERPALEAIKALKELNREDIAIFTCDLDEEVSTYLAKERFVKGLSSQRPYEQGIAAGLATVKALLGHDSYKYIAVEPYKVQSKNLLKAWKDIMSEPAPEKIEKIIKEKFT